MADNWRTIDTAPERVPVQIKIDDQYGPRNERVLTRSGKLWFTGPECEMYVYYTPTHWRPVSNGERG